MPTTTIKMGKRGTIVLPSQVRKQFGLEDGSLLNIDVAEGRISLSPSYAYDVEVWTPQRKAYLTLINAMTKEEYDQVGALLREEGIDPTDADGLDPNHRNTLPTQEEWNRVMAISGEKPEKRGA
jgi:AbrB family looped-hinge helix DNA binding protein